MESSNGNTPLPEDMNKPPEGVVVPPKDIRGVYESVFAQDAANLESSNRREERGLCGTKWTCFRRCVGLLPQLALSWTILMRW